MNVTKQNLILSTWIATIFSGAFLLFLIQPLICKAILPLLGGSPSVWNACMLFFQFVLLGGYLYAHLISKVRDLRLQILIHLVVIGASLALLPIGLQPGLKPDPRGSPLLWLLLVLLSHVGLPFFILAAAGPLLQTWFARVDQAHANDPYFLYAASNLGSMLALLAYPVLFEPLMRISTQNLLWSAGYGAQGLLVGGCAFLFVTGAKSLAPAKKQTVSKPISSQQKLWWLVLAFVPSSMMLGVTQHLTSEVVTIPLLWIVPLAGYLLTFIAAFSPTLNKQAFPIAEFLLPLSLILVVTLLALGLRRPILPQMFIHLFNLLLVGLLCHGKLAAERPAVDRMTEFYLLISAGGVLGGIFNSIVAPLTFNWIAEYPIAIVTAALAWWLIVSEKNRQWPRKPADFFDLAIGPILVLLAFIAAPAIAKRFAISGRLANIDWSAVFVFGLPGLACLLFYRDKLKLFLSISLLAFIARFNVHSQDSIIYQVRTFFGIHKVYDIKDGSGSWHALYHGATLHGNQYTQSPWADAPTTYYTKSGPIGDIMAVLASANENRNIGFVGLGAGTVGTYGKENWQLKFFEIDPEIVRIAQNNKLFTYLGKAKSPYTITLGDARLALADEPDGFFDLILLDAFSSDTIPVHLLTLEAVELYLAKLKPNGILTFHITNWYFDLEKVISAIRDQKTLVALIRRDDDISESQTINEKKTVSVYVVLARDQTALAGFQKLPQWHQLPQSRKVNLWTDNFSNVLGILR